ncbi:MAG TPA: ATP-binding protein [Terriglobia bacterium]|nr:ATP-binding protein [Terriglobia bacterium]
MNDTDIKSLIRQGEGQRIEFKESFPVQAWNLAKEIAAFATSNDGTIVIGVSDDGEIRGLPKGTDKANLVSRIEGLCKETIDPPITPHIEFVIVDKVEILCITVKKGPSPIYLANGIPYLRHITASTRARASEIVDLVRRSTPKIDAVNGASYTQRDFEFGRQDYFNARIPDNLVGRQIGFWIAAVPDEPLSLGRVSQLTDIWPSGCLQSRS